jgi:hypothetical protein
MKVLSFFIISEDKNKFVMLFAKIFCQDGIYILKNEIYILYNGIYKLH